MFLERAAGIEPAWLAWKASDVAAPKPSLFGAPFFNVFVIKAHGTPVLERSVTPISISLAEVRCLTDSCHNAANKFHPCAVTKIVNEATRLLGGRSSIIAVLERDILVPSAYTGDLREVAEVLPFMAGSPRDLILLTWLTPRRCLKICGDQLIATNTASPCFRCSSTLRKRSNIQA